MENINEGEDNMLSMKPSLDFTKDATKLKSEMISMKHREESVIGEDQNLNENDILIRDLDNNINDDIHDQNTNTQADQHESLNNEKIASLICNYQKTIRIFSILLSLMTIIILTSLVFSVKN